MTQEQILKAINQVFIDVLDDDDLVLTQTDSADDIEDWDSLTHIQIVVAIEKHFKLKFSAAEIQNWKNVGDMILSVQNKLK